MNFKEWKETQEYKELIEVFGNHGYVEAIAETSFNAGKDSKNFVNQEKPKTIYQRD